MGKCSLYYHVFVLEKDLQIFHFIFGRFSKNHYPVYRMTDSFKLNIWVMILIHNNIWLFDLCHWKHGSYDRGYLKWNLRVIGVSEVKGEGVLDCWATHYTEKEKINELLKGCFSREGNDLPKMINYCIYRHYWGTPWLFSGWVSVLSLVGLRVWPLVRELRLCMLVKGKIQKEHNQWQIKISCIKTMKMVYIQKFRTFKSHIIVQNSCMSISAGWYNINLMLTEMIRRNRITFWKICSNQNKMESKIWPCI